MNILWLFDTCGYIFGPAMIIAGVFALFLCLRASRPSCPRSAQRRAVAIALSPALIGLCGALVGLALWAANRMAVDPWEACGKVCLAGMAVSAVPLIWSLLLLRGKPGAAKPLTVA